MILADYQSRYLDRCYFCGLKYNVGERIPRILIHCGHTFCTQCLNHLHYNFRVRCPACRKLIKNLESIEKLPLNIDVLYEVVQRDPVLQNANFDEQSLEDDIENKLCQDHQDRVKHFYCSNHLTVFCRECIKEQHTQDECFVVDLYEIEKMKKLQKQNILLNRKQLKKRKDGANIPCCITDPFEGQEVTITQIKTKKQDRKHYESQKKQPHKIEIPEKFLKENYEDEAIDEARTNEEVMDDMQNLIQAKFLAEVKGSNNCVFFTEEGEYEEVNSSQCEDESEEEGEFDPSHDQQLLVDNDDY